MKKALAAIGRLIALLYNKLGDPRSKNVLLFVLAAMTLFGVLAPEAATSIRDIVLSFAL